MGENKRVEHGFSDRVSAMVESVVKTYPEAQQNDILRRIVDKLGGNSPEERTLATSDDPEVIKKALDNMLKKGRESRPRE